MSGLEGLFPNAGSYTGSTRNPLANKSTENVDACQKNDDVTLSTARAPIKMEPVTVARSLLTDEVSSQIFTAQQSMGDVIGSVNSKLAHSVTDAYTTIANKELSKAGTNIFCAA